MIIFNIFGVCELWVLMVVTDLWNVNLTPFNLINKYQCVSNEYTALHLQAEK
jgi:hypothetical protein